MAISFSGGRSSAVMAKLCMDKYRDTHDILVTFVNTGQEMEDTLRFVNDVDKHFLGGSLVWIEGVFFPGQRKGPSFKVVNFETADRVGTPFRAAVEKYGVFNTSFKQCTSRLKEEPLIAYRRSMGWGRNTYDVAIGIRADEIDRVAAKAKEKRFVYPLIEAGIRKQDVLKYMSQFEWDLKLPSEAYGNCKWCWKKSLRKLLTVASEHPEHFDFPDQMETEFGHVQNGKQEGRRVFFRGNRSAKDILELARTSEFEPYRDDVGPVFGDDLDIGSACGESCEIGADE